MGTIDSEVQYNWGMTIKPVKITVVQDGDTLKEYSFTLTGDANLDQWVHVFKCILTAQTFDAEVIKDIFVNFEE